MHPSECKCHDVPISDLLDVGNKIGLGIVVPGSLDDVSRPALLGLLSQSLLSMSAHSADRFPGELFGYVEDRHDNVFHNALTYMAGLAVAELALLDSADERPNLYRWNFLNLAHTFVNLLLRLNGTSTDDADRIFWTGSELDESFRAETQRVARMVIEGLTAMLERDCLLPPVGHEPTADKGSIS